MDDGACQCITESPQNVDCKNLNDIQQKLYKLLPHILNSETLKKKIGILTTWKEFFKSLIEKIHVACNFSNRPHLKKIE